MKKAMGLLFFVLSWTVSVGAEENEEVLTIKTMEIIGTEFSEKYIRRFITFQEEDKMTESQLKKAIRNSQVLLQNEENVYFLFVDYTVEGSEVFLTLEVSDAQLKFSFSAFESGPIVGYRNLFGEGIDGMVYLGYSRQMVELDWKRINNSSVGFSILAGHRIFNPFKPEYMASALGATSRLYFWLTPQTKIGFVNHSYWNIKNKNHDGIPTLAVGAYMENNSSYLLDIIRIGFGFQTEYLYYVKDLTNGVHKVNIRHKALIRPFLTDRLFFNTRVFLTWASGDLVNRGGNSFSPESGRTAWEAGLFMPVNIIKIDGGASFYVGLEPGVLVGKAGTEKVDFSDPDWGVSLAPTFQVGFPASVFFAPRVIYNVSQGTFSFSFSFSNIPYTTELEMGW